jgi:hypothetical protein
MCRDINASFDSITNQCAHLTPYGVTARYPNELCPDENMARIAINEARQVYDLAAAFCQTP